MAENLDLEVFNHALSFEIKNIRVKSFESMAMFDEVMDHHLMILTHERIDSETSKINSA